MVTKYDVRDLRTLICGGEYKPELWSTRVNSKAIGAGKEGIIWEINWNKYSINNSMELITTLVAKI